MIIEIQIRAELLRRIVRNRFLGRVICIPELPGPGKQVVDHLDFGQATLAREVADMAAPDAIAGSCPIDPARTDLFHAIRVAATVLWGDRDTIVPTLDAEKIVSAKLSFRH